MREKWFWIGGGLMLLIGLIGTYVFAHYGVQSIAEHLARIFRFDELR